MTELTGGKMQGGTTEKMNELAALKNKRLAAFETGGAIEWLIKKIKGLVPYVIDSEYAKKIAELEALLAKKEGE